MDKIIWDETSQKQFGNILEQIPFMIRGIAEARISKKLESILIEQGRNLVTQKDMIDAFFAETPAGFIPQMKASMDELKIDYKQYGY